MDIPSVNTHQCARGKWQHSLYEMQTYRGESCREVAVVTKRDVMNLQPRVQQVPLCTEHLLPPQSTEGQTAHHYTTTLFSVLVTFHFTVLCSVLFFSLSSHPESLLLGEMRGVTMNHSWVYVYTSVCARGCACGCVRTSTCMCTIAHTCISWVAM